MLFSYLRTAYRNPGFIEQISDNIIAKENNIDITITKPKKQPHHKYLSTENEDNISNDLADKSKLPELKPSDAESIQKNIEDNKNPSKNPSEVEEKEEVIVFETRYCTLCCLEQPLRAKHCRECGKCVALHDHHCPWLGICIGEKNRFYFWWYLFFEFILLWISGVLVGMSFTHSSGVQWLVDNWAKLLVVLLLSFFIFMVTCLFGYHTFLAIANQTTWENVSWEKISYLKQNPRKLGSPFSKGIRFNLWFYCWKKLPSNFTVWNITKR